MLSVVVTFAWGKDGLDGKEIKAKCLQVFAPKRQGLGPDLSQSLSPQESPSWLKVKMSVEIFLFFVFLSF